MLRSIKWKLVAMYFGLVLIVMIVSGTYILLSLQNIEVDKSKNQLELYAEKINEQVISSNNEDSFQQELAKASSNTVGMQGNILDAQGNTLASTAVSQKPYPEFKSSVIIAALSGTTSFGSGKKNTDTFGLVKEWMSYALPIKDAQDNIRYIVYTQLDGSDMRNSLNQTKRTITISMILALLLTAVMGYVFARTLTGPILELTGRAKELAQGNLNQKLTVHSSDEIGQLTYSFNDMAEKLNVTMTEMAKEKNKLEIILHNMTDGVLSFHKDGTLIHANQASLEMLELDKAEFTFSSFIKAFDINSGIYLDMGPDFTKQVTFPVGKKFLNASFSPYSSKVDEIEGLVVVLQDITEQKKLDDMRKEFVANVSHELRTPLTTVKSYTETLMDGAIDEKEIAMDFLSIIDSEADRMAFLVRDLLQLSRFDNKQIVLNLTDIDVNIMLEEIVRQNKIHAENKRQNLYYVPYEKNIVIRADRDRIGQVMNNIVTNAIKYSLDTAEIKIFVTEDKNYYKITVKDTGMGMQREDIPRIFERFYRVDKARSRAMGGTGLGLAIAKDIMESHNGKITVESEYGKGTAMTIWFLKHMEV